LGVDEDPAISCLVKFGKKDSLPLAEKDFTVDNGHRNGRLARQELTDMGVTVDELVLLEVLCTKCMVVMLVIGIARNKTINRTPKVVEETSLRFIDQHGCRRVRRVHNHLTVRYPGSFHNPAHDIGDIPELGGGGRRDMERFGPDRGCGGYSENHRLIHWIKSRFSGDDSLVHRRSVQFDITSTLTEAED